MRSILTWLMEAGTLHATPTMTTTFSCAVTLFTDMCDISTLARGSDHCFEVGRPPFGAFVRPKFSSCYQDNKLRPYRKRSVFSTSFGATVMRVREAV
jgi:hypothetical protein